MQELQGNIEAPLSVFIAYAHEDESLRQQLETHLSLLRRQGLTSEWHDGEILPGAEWNREIDEHLEAASIILLLISADFLASNCCYDKDMKRALERHQRGEARVIPIILRQCDWHASPFARLQCLPRNGKAVTSWQNPDEAFLSIAQELRRTIEKQSIPMLPLSKVEQQNRTRLLERVRLTWIKGVLNQSLYQEARIALNLQDQPDALADPWNLTLQRLGQPGRTLLPQTKIIEVYDEALGELLILGDPGAGKTTLLLELAQTLLQRAQSDERHPFPVIFPLASWAVKRPSIDEWMVEELYLKYQVPRPVGRAWASHEQIFPLFDGLDEVAAEHRAACIGAINTYRREHSTVPMVVCSRTQEYMAETSRLQLQSAVTIKPLDQEQVETFLQHVGSSFAILQAALQEDAILRELITSPLMLSVFTLAYQGQSVDEHLLAGSVQDRRQFLLATYVQRMLERHHAKKAYSLKQTKYWLHWLAKQLIIHNQTEFYFEELQPNWFRRVWLFRLTFGLLNGLIFGLVSGLAYLINSKSILAALVGLFITLRNWLPREWLFRLYLFYREGNFGLTLGLTIGLTLGLTIGLIDGLDEDAVRIQPSEIVVWSWRSLQEHLHQIFINILVYGLAVGLVSGLGSGLVIGLISGLGGGLVIGLHDGLNYAHSSSTLEKSDRLVANQGLRRSARYALFYALIYGLVIGLVIGLLYGLGGGLVTGLDVGLSTALLGALLGARASGEKPWLQHVSLRLLLWLAGYIPSRYIHFLDHTARCVLLRKVGGGYTFIHRLLLDYFASLEKES